MELKKQILEIIENNAKLTAEELAVMTGANKDDVVKAIEELERDKIIFGYKALINWDKTESDKVSAYIEINVTPEQGLGFESIADNIIREFPQVKSVTLMSGGFDLLIEIDGDNMKEIALFVAEKISPLKCVVSTKTHFVLRKYKQDGVVLNSKNKDERRVISL